MYSQGCMEGEKMGVEGLGLDLTRIAFVIIGNAILITAGVWLISYLERVISRLLEEQAQREHQYDQLYKTASEYRTSKNTETDQAGPLPNRIPEPTPQPHQEILFLFRVFETTGELPQEQTSN